MDSQMDSGERFNFAFAMHARLSRGGHLRTYRCDDFGITLTESCERRGDRVKRQFTADALEGRTFSTLKACLEAMRETGNG